jgi:hypothetical protein
VVKVKKFEVVWRQAGDKQMVQEVKKWTAGKQQHRSRFGKYILCRSTTLTHVRQSVMPTNVAYSEGAVSYD